jgi:hypothetical protein
MQKKHIKKIKPLKITQTTLVKIKNTGLACVPSGDPSKSSL